MKYRICLLKTFLPLIGICRTNRKKWMPICVLSCLMCGTAQAAPQQNSSPTPSASVSTSVSGITTDVALESGFDAIFRTISSQTHTTILVEGVPLHARLTTAQIASLREGFPKHLPIPVTLPVIEEIAAAFEYDVEQSDERTFLLRKKYVNPEDLPCVTFTEVVHSLKAIDKIASVYSPPDAPMKIVQQIRFVNSFSTEQLAEADKSIQVSSLPPAQRDQAIAVAGVMWLGTKVQNLHALLRELTRLDDPRSQFEWIDEHAINGFGYTGPFGPNHLMWPVPLNHGARSVVGNGIRQVPVSKTEPDPTAPTAWDREMAPGMLVNRLPSTHTIAEFVQSVGPKPSSLKVAIEDGIGDKPFGLFGEEYTTRQHTIRALASLYGLSLLVPKEDDFTIVMPRQRTIERADDIPKEVRRMIPLPIAHFMAAHPLVGSVLMGNGPVALTNAPGQPKLSGQEMAARIAAQQEKDRVRQADEKITHDIAMDIYYLPAVRRLLALTLPFVPTPQSKPVPITSMNPEVLRLIAIIRMAGLPLSDIDGLENLQVPPIMNDPESMFVSVQRTDKHFGIDFGPSARNARGEFSVQIGEGVVNPPKLDNPLLHD